MTYDNSCAAIALNEKWDPYFYPKFLGFKNSLPLWERVNFFDNWPLIDDYNLIKDKVANITDFPITFAIQSKEMQYESEIYEKRIIPTRLCHWHDFFNNLTWMMFPKIKWAIIQKSHQEKIGNVDKKRTSTQNVLAHFDECGIILCSDKPEFFEYFKNFQWKKSFWDLRDELQTHCYPIIFGHGILEKALTPYIGLTAKSIFLNVPSSFFGLSATEKITFVDRALSRYILSPDFPILPKALSPFPLLGWPSWHSDNQQANFYDNANYFRVKPRDPCGFVAIAKV